MRGSPQRRSLDVGRSRREPSARLPPGDLGSAPAPVCSSASAPPARRLQRRLLILAAGDLGEDVRGVLATALAPTNLLRYRVAPRLHLLRRTQRVAARLIECQSRCDSAGSPRRASPASNASAFSRIHLMSSTCGQLPKLSWAYRKPPIRSSARYTGRFGDLSDAVACRNDRDGAAASGGRRLITPPFPSSPRAGHSAPPPPRHVPLLPPREPPFPGSARSDGRTRWRSRREGSSGWRG